MATEENVLLAKIKQAREQKKKRKFTQTVDLIVALKGMDLKKPENRLNIEMALPEGKGKPVKVAVIVDSLAMAAEGTADLVIKKQEIEPLSKDKKNLSRLADQYDWFFGEASLMPLIGKTLGLILGPKGKMPKPMPPNANVKNFVEAARKNIRIRLKDTPVIQVAIGSENMADEQIERNLRSTLNFIKERLPKGLNNIRSAYLKLTMGKPVKLEVK